MTNSKSLIRQIDQLLMRYPKLECCKESIKSAYFMLENMYQNGGKLLIAGNGGSAADAEHIAGELMKRFRLRRKVPESFAEKLRFVDQERGNSLAGVLERSLPAIPLVAHEALTTAYMNDVNSFGVFAQQLYGYGNKGDVFLGISTSGNSENIIQAAVVAKAMDVKVIGLTGNSGGKLKELVDILICVPETETYLVQELHLPIYHCLCMMLEESFFKESMQISMVNNYEGHK